MAASEVSRDRRAAVFLHDAGLSPPEKIPILTRLEAVDFGSSLPDNVAAARSLLAKQRTSEPGYQQPGVQKRHLFRTKGQKEAMCNTDNWVFTKYEVAKTLDSILSAPPFPSPGVAQAVLVHASTGSLYELWQHLHDTKLEKRMSKRFSRGSVVSAVPRVTWLDQAASQEDIDYVRLLCQVGLHQDALDGAFGVALSKHSMDVMKVLLSFGAVASSHQDLIRERIKLGDIGFAKLLLSAPDTMTADAWRFCIEPEIEDSHGTPNVLHLCLAHRFDVVYPNLLLRALSSQNLQAIAIILAYTSSSGIFRDAHQHACELASAIQDELLRVKVFIALDKARFLSDGPILREELLKDVKTRHLSLIRILADAGVTVDTESQNAFYWAVSNMDLEILELFRRGTFSLPVSLALNIVPESAPEKDIVRLVEILSSQGLSGDALDSCLIRAVRKQQVELVSVLLHHRASVEFDQASAIRIALENADFNILDLLLRSKCSPQTLSTTIPTAMGLQPRSVRLEAMKALLNKGILAKKLAVPLQSLVSGHGDVDFTLTQLLLQHDAPPDGVGDSDVNPVLVSVRRANLQVLRMLCEAAPLKSTLSAAVPIAFGGRNYHGEVALDMMQLLMEMGATGLPVDETLLVVVREDPRLDIVRVLVDHGADANYAAGAAYTVAINEGNLPLLEILCSGCPPIQATIQTLLPKLTNPVSYDSQILELFLASARPDVAGPALDASWTTGTFKSHPEVDEILPCFLRHGLNVNLQNGALLRFAIQKQSITLLGEILSANPNIASLTAAFHATVGMYPRDAELEWMTLLLDNADSAEIGQSAALVSETNAALGGDFRGFKLLLRYKANVEAEGGKAVQEAAVVASTEVLELLLSAQPSSDVLDKACLAVVSSSITPEQKHTVLERLLDANTTATTESMSALLGDSIDMAPEFAPLPQLLMARGVKIKGRVFKAALKTSSQEVLFLLVGKRRSSDVATTMFRLARNVEMDSERRYWVYKYLLERKVSTGDVSDALVDSFEVDNLGDLSLPKLLLQHGATVDHEDGAAFAAALRANSLDAIRLLSQYIVDDKMADVAFALAREAAFIDTSLRLELYRCFLQWNISKSSTSSALLDSFENGYSSVPIVEMLLENGADPNENKGLCFAVASRLGVEPEFRALSKRAELTVVLQALLDHFQEEWEVVWWFGVCLELQPSSAKMEQDELLFQCLRRFPWGTSLLTLLLDMGVSTSAKITHSICEGWTPELCTVLVWSLFQTPKIENEPILALMARGGHEALPAYTTPTTKVSAAFGCLLDKSRLPVLKALFKLEKERILEQMMLGSTFGHLAAYPSVSSEALGFFDDSNEIFLREAALYLGNYDAFRLIKSKETPNDGTLHLAALLALPKFVKHLMDVHDPDNRAEEYDFMIPLALACESKPVPWCRVANEEDDWLTRQKKTIELLAPKTKPNWRYRHKTVLHMALGNGPEVTKAMVSALDIRHDSERDERYMFVDRSGLHYSPDQYVKHMMQVSKEEKRALMACLAHGKMQSRYYRVIEPNMGAQPAGYCGLPARLQKIWKAHEDEWGRWDQ